MKTSPVALCVLLALLSAHAPAQSPPTGDLAAKSQRGRQAMGEGRFEEAIAIYSEIVESLPNESGMALNLGMAYAMASRPRDAIPHLERALKLRPGLMPARLFLGSAYLELGQPVKAIAPLRKLLAEEPGNLQARRLLADALLLGERYEGAAAEFRRLTRVDTNDPAAWYGLARSYAGEARRVSSALQASHADSPYVLLLAAEQLAAQQKHAAAFELYREALERLPDWREAHEAITAIYDATGHPDWAAQERRAVAKIPQPDCPKAGSQRSPAPAPARRAECAFRVRQYVDVIAATGARRDPALLYWRTRAANELAVQAFDRLADLPPSRQTHQMRADLLRSQERYLEAATELGEALKLAPGDPGLERELASALYLSRDFDGARAILERLVARDPHSAELAFLYGDTLLQAQQVDRAVDELARAVSLNPAFIEVHASLGRAYLQLGRPRDAIPHLAKAVAEGRDEDGSLHYQLARAYQAAGESELARTALQQYQEIQKALDAAKGLKREAKILPPR